MTISTHTELTQGQQRTAAARATRTRQANEKAAARLRDAGFVVVPPESVRKMAGVIAESSTLEVDYVRGFGDALKAMAEVSDVLGCR